MNPATSKRAVGLTLGAVVALSAVSLSACTPQNQNEAGAAKSEAANYSGKEAEPPSTAVGAKEANKKVDLKVLAASSTRVLNDDLANAAESLKTPSHLTISNGGSSELVSQLKEGAPADILITASKKTMDDAVANGSVKEPKVLARNTMVMVVPKGNPAGIKSVADLKEDTKLVLCDPQVPCGDTSKKIIDSEGLTLKAVSEESQVADVLGKVSSGEADAGWVYSTDAQSAGDDVEVIEIEGANKFPNDVVGAVTANSANPEAAQEVITLLAQDFADSWRAHGFSPAS